MVIAADAGMLSATNLTALDEVGLGFIVGSRSVKAPIDLASHFRWNGHAFTNTQIIDTVTPRHANSIVNDLAHRGEPAWNPDERSGAWRAIRAYSAKRARRDQKIFYAQETRARAVINGERTVKSTRFVKTHAGDAFSMKPAWPARNHWWVEGLRHQDPGRGHARGRSDRQVTTCGASSAYFGFRKATFAPARCSTAPATRSKHT